MGQLIDRARLSSALVAAAALASCVPYGSSEAIKPLPASVARASYISTIEIKAVPPDVSPEFRGKLDAALRTAMSKCATGQHAVRLEVSVVRFSPQNPALTILAGDSNVIRGSAQLVDLETGGTIGDYDINRSVGGGGLIAALAMSGAEAQSVNAFAKDICDQAFAH